MSTPHGPFEGIALFQGVSVDLEQGTVDRADPEQQTAIEHHRAVARSKLTIDRLLPIVNIDLTPAEKQRTSLWQEARLVLGPTVALIQVCSQDCPFLAPCPLAQANRHPVGALCPFETSYVNERFFGWMQELGRSLETLTESERSAISTLTWIDVQEMRCNQALSTAEAALLQQRSVRDVNLETGDPICWEDVVHINAQRLDQLVTQRRAILRDFELTPEAKTRRAKALGVKDRGDLSTRQSKAFDLIRQSRRQLATVDVSATPGSEANLAQAE